jgi:hypothetical protein
LSSALISPQKFPAWLVDISSFFFTTPPPGWLALGLAILVLWLSCFVEQFSVEIGTPAGKKNFGKFHSLASISTENCTL